MNGVIAGTELMLTNADSYNLSNEQRELLNIVKSSGEAMLTLIADILDLSKIEAGKLELELNFFSILNCVDIACDIVAHRAAQKSVAIIYSIDPSVPLLIHSDQHRLKQILFNLLSNAIKFTPALSGQIVLSVKAKQLTASPLFSTSSIFTGDSTDQFEVPIHAYELEFCVNDNGIGILEADQIKLFHSFSQINNESTKSMNLKQASALAGTGLGLAISRSLVHLLGGKIWVESDPKSYPGAKFLFTIHVKGVQSVDISALKHTIQFYHDNFNPLSLSSSIDSKLDHEFLNMLKGLELTSALNASEFEVPCFLEPRNVQQLQQAFAQDNGSHTNNSTISKQLSTILIVKPADNILTAMKDLLSNWLEDTAMVTQINHLEQFSSIFNSGGIIRNSLLHFSLIILDCNILSSLSKSSSDKTIAGPRDGFGGQLVTFLRSHNVPLLLMQDFQNSYPLQEWTSLSSITNSISYPIKPHQFFQALCKCKSVQIQTQSTLLPTPPLFHSRRLASEASIIAMKPNAPELQLRILCAEDSLINQKLLRKMLTQIGYPEAQFEIVENGKFALETIQNVNSMTAPSISYFQLLFLDLSMPVMDGFESCKLIRSYGDSIYQPFICALTAHAMTSDEEKCKLIGMNAFITKPINIKSIKSILQQTLHYTKSTMFTKPVPSSSVSSTG
jgi:CheY-like chemotaxis protein